MFSEDAENDMFAATPVAGRAGAAQPNKPRALADNFDDAEGYYNFQASTTWMLRARSCITVWPKPSDCLLSLPASFTPQNLPVLQVGEVMDGRYEVFATHGKGVFSTVLRARDKKAQTMTGVTGEVAIKMIRANDTMFTAGQVGCVLPGCGQVTCSNRSSQEHHVCVAEQRLCTPQGQVTGYQLQRPCVHCLRQAATG